ncbi:MAG: IclR family transcriptional regulator [Desulfuromonadaceae bacterium]|nr:IclR family transcriptional regulator [Desulfuromonadaceae bacterium]
MHYLDASLKPFSRANASFAYSGAQSRNRKRFDYTVKSVAHAFDILELFFGNIAELRVSELSRRLGLPKNNIFRLLATLESRNYIEQNEYRSGYRLGYKCLQLGNSMDMQKVLHQQSKPVLELLTKESGETSNIAIQKGDQIFYIDVVEASHPVRVMPRIGIMTPAYCTGAGKVLLAGNLEREQHNFLPHMEFRRHTPNTIIDPHEFENHLQIVAAQGYAIEDEEFDAGLRGVAAPVRSHYGTVVGAVCVSGPVMRFDSTRMRDELVPMVVSAAEEISRRFGYCSQPEL